MRADRGGERRWDEFLSGRYFGELQKSVDVLEKRADKLETRSDELSKRLDKAEARLRVAWPLSLLALGMSIAALFGVSPMDVLGLIGSFIGSIIGLP